MTLFYKANFDDYDPYCRRCHKKLGDTTFRHEVGVFADNGKLFGFVTIFLCPKCEKEDAIGQLDNAVKEISQYADN